MKQAILSGIVLWSLLAGPSLAQRGGMRMGGMHMGGGRAGRFFGRPFGPMHPLRRLQGGFAAAGWALPVYSGIDSGLGYPGYDSSIVIMPQQTTCAPSFAEPPVPVRPEMHEYKWPDSAAGPKAAFSIVSTSGDVHSAIAVWQEGKAIRYITTDGADRKVTLDSINREATRLANAEKHLFLPLPSAN